MQPSLFTPVGLWRCSSRKPSARAIFDQQRAGMGGQFDVSAESAMGAFLYANAIGQARTRQVVEAAALQRIPRRASYLMPQREEEYGLVPSPNASLTDRREEYARKFKVVQCTSHVAVEAALLELLGDDFVGLRATPTAEIATLSQADGLDVNYQRPDVTRKVVRLLNAVSFIGVPSTVAFEYVFTAPSTTDQDQLVAGDVIVVDPGRLGWTERVEVTAVAPVLVLGVVTGYTLTAEFAFSHDAGTIGLTHPYPGLATSKRHSLVVVTQSAALDPEKRRRINELMQLHARSTSTWDIVAADGDNVQQFLIGAPSIGISTVEQFAISP